MQHKMIEDLHHQVNMMQMTNVKQMEEITSMKECMTWYQDAINNLKRQHANEIQDMKGKHLIEKNEIGSALDLNLKYESLNPILSPIKSKKPSKRPQSIVHTVNSQSLKGKCYLVVCTTD